MGEPTGRMQREADFGRNLMLNHLTQGVQRLGRCRFPAVAVLAATRIDDDTLTKFTIHSGLELWSERRQGVPREFYLIEVYQLALLAEFWRLTRSIKSTADALNTLLFYRGARGMKYPGDDSPTPDQIVRRALAQGPEAAPDRAALAAKFCQDILTAPEPYWHRDREHPVYAAMEGGSIAIYWRYERPPLNDSANATAIICNATALLDGVDDALVTALTDATESKRRRDIENERARALAALKRAQKRLDEIDERAAEQQAEAEKAAAAGEQPAEADGDPASIEGGPKSVD